jgi:hypothetical protein
MGTDLILIRSVLDIAYILTAWDQNKVNFMSSFITPITHTR